MEIPRFVAKKILSQIGKQKVLMLYGSRRTGKTTIIEEIQRQYESQTLFLLGEDAQVAEVLQNRTVANYKQLIGENKLVIIDEAQAVSNIGKILKLMIDSIPGITIIATGSSSLDLVNDAGEPLVGRQLVHQLFPLAQVEFSKKENMLESLGQLETRLIYGGYPELTQLPSLEEKEEYLKSLINSYLLKDLLALTNIKGADVLFRLLKLLAFQVGSQVSTVELGNSLQLNKETVDRYLDLLSKVFVIFPLSGFSQNLRKEVSKSKKWYFYDNGIRNALINNFSPISFRNDLGQLWEQWMIIERMKFNSSKNYFPQYYFWRTYDGQEIDLLEVNSQQEIQGLEFKWGNKKSKVPVAFAKGYPEAKWDLVTKADFWVWVS
ncbi:ATP-binding protein [Algoriphagus sp.]|jgi:predicted AAA+ superfamily ATPase|uniref:ATP-binding protein n=1 Tax=Algoriphagus sp. TaxID=1872435 RepID=UPI0027182B11|nr:ATP-binding protein [Algoriphagus sp.]MDO8967089.1 ATP-binding protein [Algoriphagus sp.]MDP3199417.1 ATP-binding protein [Algoriphagus sp.]